MKKYSAPCVWGLLICSLLSKSLWAIERSGISCNLDKKENVSITSFAQAPSSDTFEQDGSAVTVRVLTLNSESAQNLMDKIDAATGTVSRLKRTHRITRSTLEHEMFYLSDLLYAFPVELESFPGRAEVWKVWFEAEPDKTDIWGMWAVEEGSNIHVLRFNSVADENSPKRLSVENAKQLLLKTIQNCTLVTQYDESHS